MSQNNLFSRTSIMLTGALVTLGLFIFMSQLVKTDQVSSGKITEAPIFHITADIPEPIPPKSIEKIKPQPITPKPERIAIPSSGGEGINSATDSEPPIMPKVVEIYSQGPVNQDALPVVQVSPQYPIGAARDGKEGYVVVEFDISTLGSVTNVNVIDAYPKRIFNKSAVRAIKGWKYKPKIVEGNPVVQPKQQVRLDFTLDKAK
ncbi:TonB family protein [Shewanella sp. KX20019]|uniref:energy transducer TonB n=1 Tax=Shewanella sp. KX20019 TaxID=2803864 RepID=UPI001926D76C|nr:energy transducer TonB [Shewanella sp. KX20019]QQX79408.1 TonB family protein [Shewanella sp. KX20019]